MTASQQPQVNVNITQTPVQRNNFRTKRGLAKYILLGIVTLSIYDI